MSRLSFILFSLLPSCNQLMGSGRLEAGMNLPLRTSTSVRHEPGGFILGYFLVVPLALCHKKSIDVTGDTTTVDTWTTSCFCSWEKTCSAWVHVLSAFAVEGWW